MRIGKNIILFGLVLMNMMPASAQYHYKQKYYPYQWTIGLNYDVYQGDLTPSYTGGYMHGLPGLNLGFKYYPVRGVDLRFNALGGALYGDDRFYKGWRHERKFNFFSPLGEASVMLEVDWGRLTSNIRVHHEKLKWFPYFFAGVSEIFFKPVIDYSKINAPYFVGDGVTYDYEKNSKVIYPLRSLAYLGGFGFKRTLSKQNSIFIEATARLSRTDWLDGFHYGVLPGKDSFWSITFGYAHFLKRKYHRHTILPCPKI